MEFHYPDYYNDFVCIASECSDNCCIGWEIDIDDDTLEYYDRLEGDFGEKLRCSVSREGTPHFILKDERCPFLNEKNLCSVILTLGEEHIGDICTRHPRFFEWFDDITEKGIGLCCEAAGKLILSRDMSIVSEGKADELPDAVTEAMFFARDTMFTIAGDKGLTARQRAGKMLAFAEELQSALDFDDSDEIRASAEFYRKATDNQTYIVDTEQLLKLAEVYRGLEPIDDGWTDFADKISGIVPNAEKLAAVFDNSDEVYGRVLAYFIYRYFMKSVFDGDVITKVQFAAAGYVMIKISDMAAYAENSCFSERMRIMNAKYFSKEVEYSEENLTELESVLGSFDYSKILI